MNDNSSPNGQQPTNGQQVLTEKQAVINETQRQYQAFEQNCIYGEEMANAVPRESVCILTPRKAVCFYSGRAIVPVCVLCALEYLRVFTTLFYMLLFIAVSLSLSARSSYRMWDYQLIMA